MSTHTLSETLLLGMEKLGILRSLQRDGLLLGFASASPQELRAGAQTLALALQAH